MVLPMLSQKLIRWLLLAAFLAQGWGWQPAIARTLASPVADRLAQTPPSTSVAVPKWLSAPTLDGQCSDAAYSEGATVPLLATLTGGGVNAHLVHSGIDFYLCLNNLPFHAGATVAMQVDSDNSRAAQPQPGDYKFSISSSGAISVTEGDGAGNFVTLPTANTAVSVTKSIDGRLWNLELQVGLEWLGGYARTDGLSLAFLDGAATLRWPLDHALNAPATWGTLTLTPLYPDGVNAGSAFIDGLGGYLVIPYAPALNPTELTIEAWVKVVDGACGTLVGNDQATAYWLALCQAIQFSTAGINTVRGGQRPLTDGWHHVAVTMDADGLRSYYLDGQLDTQYGWHPAEEERTGEPEVVEKLGVAKTMLRIGSDRTADSADSSWHGYVQDLRIWNVPRTQAEIQATIFASPSPTATGLLAWWPFASGLQDVAGGHHAGLVGNAALAHATRDITRFC